ncbi:MAG: DUF6056 family protein [Muribaculum sp.]|nr:DUF6056 family protein [Muribaculum sp.]
MRNDRFYTITQVIISILFAIIYILTPPGADDLLFLSGHETNISTAETLGEIANTIAYRWTTETGRLGTFISIVFLLLDAHVLFGVLSGLAIYLLLTLAAKLAGARKGSVISWLLTVAIVFCLPWYDYLFLCSYGVNYIWSSMLAVMASYAFMHTGNTRGLKAVAVASVMFLSGWMHEAYGVPLCVAATGWLLLKKKSLTKAMVLNWISLGIGTLMTFLSKAFWNRTEGKMLIEEFPLREFILQLGPSIFLLMLFATAIIYGLSGSKRCTILRGNVPEVVYFSLFIAISSIITFRYFCGARSAMPLSLMSIIGAAYIFNLCTSTCSKKFTGIFGLISAIICVLHLTYTVSEQSQRKKEYYEIEAMYMQSEDGSFFYDVTFPKVDFSLLKTSVRQFHEKTPIWMWDKYHNRESGDKHLLILPTDISNFAGIGNPSRTTKGVQIYNNWVIADPEIFETSEHHAKTIKLVKPGGDIVTSRYRTEQFKAKDGKEYTLLIPHEKILDRGLNISDVILQP